MDRFPGISAEELAMLREADTPTVCNVIELFEVRPRSTGYLDARISACFPELPPMVGYAATATFRAAAPAPQDRTYAELEGQLDSFGAIAEPRVVVFQDLDNPPAAATFGELMCGTYKSFGCAGLITSGAGRDLAQVRALEFPVFTSGTICAHGYVQILDVNVPVHVGGVTIQPGDLLHGDGNGVTTIPNTIAGDVARLCAGFAEAEGHVLKFIKSGSRDRQALAAARAACRRKIEELRAQARSAMRRLRK